MEEIAWMPRVRWLPIYFWHLLISDRYYLYLVGFDELLDAGSTLKDVYEGLRQAESVSTLSGCPWEDVEPFEER